MVILESLLGRENTLMVVNLALVSFSAHGGACGRRAPLIMSYIL